MDKKTTKTSKPNKPMADIAGSNKSSTHQSLLIHSRPILDYDTAAEPTTGSSEPEPTTAPEVLATTGKTIKVEAADGESLESPKADIPAEPPVVETPDLLPQTSELPATPIVALDEPESKDSANDSLPAKKLPPETVQPNTPADVHDRELQESINNREYFVPINAVARTHSIKVSILLTLLVILLAAVLIDLMLDTEFILLLQKIPHTHFFGGIN